VKSKLRRRSLRLVAPAEFDFFTAKDELRVEELRAKEESALQGTSVQWNCALGIKLTTTQRPGFQAPALTLLL
jgi:hypothetical protein